MYLQSGRFLFLLDKQLQCMYSTTRVKALWLPAKEAERTLVLSVYV
ncbi:hypothetical protein B834_397 [Enterococcus mundtii 1A]|nr:hypothetical protein [Enterococcus mundtii 1A]